MPRTINTHAYATREISGRTAVYAATISDVPHVARFSSTPARRLGVAGVLVSRTVEKHVTGTDSVVRPVTFAVSAFYPTGVAASEMTSVIAESVALQGEATFAAQLAAQSLD